MDRYFTHCGWQRNEKRPQYVMEEVNRFLWFSGEIVEKVEYMCSIYVVLPLGNEVFVLK